jgi:hypothetical protein
MHRKDMWAVVAYLIPTVGLLLQGLLYVTTPRFMSYHADALGTTWEELPANYQGFMLGVLKAMGAGSVAVTVALLIMILIPFRRGQAWRAGPYRWSASCSPHSPSTVRSPLRGALRRLHPGCKRAGSSHCIFWVRSLRTGQPGARLCNPVVRNRLKRPDGP